MADESVLSPPTSHTDFPSNQPDPLPDWPDAEFLKLNRLQACFHNGFKYIFNSKYKNKDGAVIHYFICSQK